MRKTLLSIPALLLCFIPALARADSIATVDVSASFVPSVAPALAIFGNGPTLFVTGQFTLDENTAAISAWNMTFLGPLGATYQLSAQNGDVATAFCFNSNCLIPGIVWKFSFSNNVASLVLSPTFHSDIVPLFAGEVLQLCPEVETLYAGNLYADSPPCDFTSHASFNNQGGVVYSLLQGGVVSGNHSAGFDTSGTLTVVSVVSTPEPPESTTLLLGIGIVLGSIRFFKKKAEAALERKILVLRRNF